MPKCPECGASIDGFSDLEYVAADGPIGAPFMYYCPGCEAILGFSGESSL